MRYKSFRIRNFKGIKDTTINLEGVAGANVFALVGLNESGKTTVLEAIHSFSPDTATSELLGGEEGTGVPIRQRVPRHLISDFTGETSVEATVSLSPRDRDIIERDLLAHGMKVDTSSFPSEMRLERYQVFEGGDYKASRFRMTPLLKVKSGSERKWRYPTSASDELKNIWTSLYRRTPDIAYFPTFVFNFPEEVYLSDRGGLVDQFYRRSFQDILDYDGRGQTIEKDIIRRLRAEKLSVSWSSFWTLWNESDDRDKIQHVLDRAGIALTKLVFGRWDKIFGEDAAGKEVIVTSDIVEGETEAPNGTKTKTNAHDIKIRFQIRDGSRRFNVNDRSLGFRWFFSFMLFTQFRVARAAESEDRPLLFLFDEPASNLHAAAQERLIDSFPEVARDEHVLVYTTHSHYMIEPKWLEQTFIVTNRSDNPPQSSILAEASLDDESLNIQVRSYRAFVNDHPTKTSYFQPILDRLDVIPSRFDWKKASIVVEGKSDYYVLRYALKLHNMSELPLLPALGAGTFGALAALSIGWNLDSFFVLDADKQGKSDREKYRRDFGIPGNRVVVLDDLVAGVNEIEDLLDAEAHSIIACQLKIQGVPSKVDIRRFFQERLASNNVNDLGQGFRERSGRLLAELKRSLPSST